MWPPPPISPASPVASSGKALWPPMLQWQGTELGTAAGTVHFVTLGLFFPLHSAPNFRNHFPKRSAHLFRNHFRGSLLAFTAGTSSRKRLLSLFELLRFRTTSRKVSAPLLWSSLPGPLPESFFRLCL
uniref:(northern house mosquito) hypothetical protein n=1 Tax=Culex pipiens TaxID=7175 RepID=A0A8D7ZV67_CULPI